MNIEKRKSPWEHFLSRKFLKVPFGLHGSLRSFDERYLATTLRRYADGVLR